MRPLAQTASEAPCDAGAADGITRVGLAELIAARVEARRLGLGLGAAVSGSRGGGHLSRFRGPGIEYDESRAYVPGDDRRAMDWRVTARAAEPHVKVYREERERPLWLLVDQGETMRFGTRTAFKSVVAARAAALLGWTAVAHGDRVGGLVWDERHFSLRLPARRERGLFPLLRTLARGPDPAPAPASRADALRSSAPRQAPAPSEQRPRDPGLAQALGPALNRVRPGSLSFVISDFAALGAADATWLARLSDQGQVILIFVYDPIEATAPAAGYWPVADAAGRRHLLDLRSAGRRRLYESRFVQQRERLAELARRSGAHWLMLATDMPVGPALARLLGGRAGRSGS